MSEITREQFKNMWIGRKFQCLETLEIFTIPKDVHYGAFYEIGTGFVDVGDGYYCRFGGKIMELDEEIL